MTAPRPSEDELIESLIWSETDYSLAEFVEKFQLPQLVNVDVGYFSGNETTSLSSCQVLNLYALVKIKKLVCQTPSNNAILIPFKCPSKVLVQPRAKDCKHTKISTHQLTTLFGQFKYIYVLEGYYNAKCPTDSFETGEILEINDMDRYKGLVRCKNVETEQNVSVPVDSTALFAPLLDYKEYTLAEIEQRFGFPAKVRFLNDAGTEDQDRGQSRRRGRNSLMLVSGLEEITVFKEIEQTVVMLTTFGGNAKDKVYLQIPKDLPVQISAALGLVRGDETYQNIVKNLDKYFDSLRLSDVQNLDVYENSDALRNDIEEIASNLRVFEQPLDEEDEPTPPLPPKRSVSLRMDGPRHSSIPPKPGREDDAGPAVKGKAPPKSPSKPTVKPKPKSFKLPRTNKPRKAILTNSPVADESGYVKPFRKPGGDLVEERRKSDSDYVYDYAFVSSKNIFCPDHIYEEAQFAISGDKTPQTCLTSGDVYEEARWMTGDGTNVSCLPKPLVSPSKPSNDDVYEDIQWEAGSETHESSFKKPLVHADVCGDVCLKTGDGTNVSCLPKPLVSPSKPSNEDVYEDVQLEAGSETHESSFKKPLVHPKPNKPHLQSKTNEKNEDSCFKRPVVYAKPTKLPRKPDNYENTEIEAGYEKLAGHSMSSELQPNSTSCDNTELYNYFKKPNEIAKPKSIHSPIDETAARGSSDPAGYDQKGIARLPNDLSGLTVSDVGEILTGLRMRDYVSVFETELVDGDMLQSMDEPSLVSLGMNAFQVKKLLKFIGGWRPNV